MSPAPAALFAEAMAELASGVAVVTVRRDDGSPSGLAATSVCSHSADPPAVLVSVDHAARSRAPLLARERFGLHILRDTQASLAVAFAGRGDDKFADLDWDWDGDVPRIEGVLAYLRCERSAVFEHGDHSIVLGTVLDARVAGGEPLVYLRRRMGWGVTPLA